MALSIFEIKALKKTPLSVVQRHVLNCLLFLKGLGLTIILCVMVYGAWDITSPYVNTLIFLQVFIFALITMHLRSSQMKKVHLALKEKAKLQRSELQKKM